MAVDSVNACEGALASADGMLGTAEPELDVVCVCESAVLDVASC